MFLSDRGRNMPNTKNENTLTPLLRQVFVVSGTALNILGHGCMHGYPAVLFSQLRHPGVGNVTAGKDQTSAEFRITDIDASWIASVLGMMGVFGILLSPVLMSHYGRQKAHLISTIPAILGWAVIYAAENVPTLIIARLLHGFAIGIRTPLAAILVAEYTSPEYRGVFLGTFAVSLGLGILITHLIGVFLTWRMTALASSLSSVLALVIIGFSPESPSWLAARGKFDECSSSFQWLRGNSEEQKKELEVLIANQKIYKSENTDKKLKSAIYIIKRKEFFKPAVIAVFMFIMFEFGGAHIIPAYANRIISEMLGKGRNANVHWQITTVDSLRMASALLAIPLLKKFNRRTILFTSGTMTVLSFILISVYIILRKNGIFNATLDSFLPMTLIVLYVLSFCLGLVPLTWVLCGEIFPLAFRSLGSTFSTLCLSPAFTLSLKTAPYLLSSYGVEGAYLFYAAILTLSLIIINPLLPETKGRTLEEIEYIFRGERSASDAEMKEILNK